VKATGAALLGFAAGIVVTVMVTALVQSLMLERESSEVHEARSGAESQRLRAAPQLSREDEPAPSARPIDVPAESRAPTAPPAADARIGILVYGAVSDPAGAPVKSDWMNLQFTPDAQAPRNVTIVADGTYAATGLVPGHCRVSANLLEFRPWHTDLELEADQPAVRLDIVLEPSDVLVIKAFTPEGKPLVDALKSQMGDRAMWELRVSAVASVEPLTSLPAQLGRGWDGFGIGYYRDNLEAVGPLRDHGAALPPDAMGLLELDVPPPVWVTLAVRSAILGSQRVEPGQKLVTFTVGVSDVTATFGTLRARMVDGSTRAPLAGVGVNINDAQDSGTSNPTGPDGLVHAAGLTPGRMRFQASLEGYERLNALVTIPPAGDVDLGDVPLAHARSVHGSVLDEQDHPVSTYVSIQNLDPPQGLAWDNGYQSWMSEQDGSLVIKGLGQHRYSLMLHDKIWVSQPLIVDTTVDDVSGVVLRALPGVGASLRLDWPETVRHGLRVSTPQGQILADWDGWQGGNVWSSRLAPGHFLAEVYDGPTVLISRPFDVGAETVNLTLKP
jgi:hypothetical protein